MVDNNGVSGLLKTGGGTSVLSGGTALTMGGIQAYFRVDRADDVLTIAMPVNLADNGRFEKSGAGKLILSNGNYVLGWAFFVTDGTFEVD